MRYHDGMIRAQVQLTEEQLERLRRMSNETGKSISALVREAVDTLPPSDLEERWRRAWSVVGKYSSGVPDIAVDHDKYLDEIYGDH